MKWTDSIKNKLVASAVLFALCLLVLLSNYLDRLHTENVKNSISTMYEDRLIVEGYVLKMTRDIYKIRENLNIGKVGQDVNAVRLLTADFKTTYDLFINTRLTKKEKSTADELLVLMREFEKAEVADSKAAFVYTDRILISLDTLSEIQLDESRLIMKQVETQYATIKNLSKFAFAIIILILIVLQVLVFSGETIVPIFKPKDPGLN